MVAANKVTFSGGAGRDLSARLDLPAGPPRAMAVFVHCFSDDFAVSRIAAELNELGIGVLRFDFTGLGLNDEEFANADFSSNLEDLRRAVAWLSEHSQPPQVLIGHSLGGAAVLSVAGEFESVRAVATIGAPSDTRHLAGLFGVDDPGALPGEGTLTATIGGREFEVTREFVADLHRHDVTGGVARLGKALLVLHSPLDNVVGVSHAVEIFAAARNPKSYISLDPADHLLSRRGDAEFAARMIGSWAERYIVEPEIFEAPAPSAQVVVGETGQGKFLNHVVGGRHRALADEPESVGGFDAGMSPYDFLAAALGACTSMTIRMYAEHKKLPLDRVVVEVQHDKVYADDSDAASTGASRKIDQFSRTLHLTGDLTPEVRQRMAEIADRCPVHRTLHESSKIVTTLAD